jgi:hypothetical protein
MMNGLFFINSGIVEKISDRIIEAKKLDNYVKVYHPRYEGTEEGYSSENLYYVGRYRYNLFKNWAEVVKGDTKLEKIFKEKFHMFCPYSYRKDIRLIISSRRCRGFSFMEEGLMSYCTEEQVEEKIETREESIREKIEYMGRLGKKSFYREGCEKRYCLTDEAFPGRKKEILDIDLGNIEKVGGIKNGSCIFVCDSIPNDIKVASVYLASLSEVMNKEKFKYDAIYFKLHPNSYGNWQGEVMRNLFKRMDNKTEEINPSSALEDFIVRHNLDVFLNLSSTGLYCGAIGGCNVFSFNNVFRSIYHERGEGEIDNKVSMIDNCVPDIFWKNVELI